MNEKIFYANHIIYYTLRLFFSRTQAQTINLNESFIQQNLRTAQLLGKFDPTFSFTSLPIHTGKKASK